MSVGSFLHKLGRGAAGVRLAMHGYTPELLEREREALQELRNEKEAERARRQRADDRAEAAAARQEQLDEENRRERERGRAVNAATALAQSTSGDDPEFLSTISPEVADLYGVRPDEQDAVLAIGRRMVQARKDAEKRKLDETRATRERTRTEGLEDFEDRAAITDRYVRARRPAPTPKEAKDPDYRQAVEIIRMTEDPDDPYTDPQETLEKTRKLAREIKARRLGAQSGVNPFDLSEQLLGALGSAGGRPGPTSPGQPVKPKRKYAVEVLP